MEDLKKFLTKYWGGIIGGIIALILACTGLYRVIVAIVLVSLGIWAGNFFKNNKSTVKEKIKKFVDKM